MNDAAKSAYRERLYRVCDYIAHHLDEPLTLEKLSAIASSSPYHSGVQWSAAVSLYPVATPAPSLLATGL